MGAMAMALTGRRGSVIAWPLDRVLSVLLTIMLAVNALFLVGLIVGGGDPSPAVSIGLSLATQWVPVAILWVVATRTAFHRVEIVLVAAAVTVSAIGDSYYSLAMDESGYLAFPSPADVGYILFYPLMIVAVALLVRRQLRGSAAIVVVESAVAALGAGALLAVAADPLISAAIATESLFESAVALAYPVFDIVLLAMIAGLAVSQHLRMGSRWWSLAVGLGIFVAADIVYAVLESEGQYLAGTPLDASWAIGLAFITWWVIASGSAVTPLPPRTHPAFTMPVAGAAVLAGLGVLVLATQVTVSVLAIVLAALTVGLAALPIIFRQAMLARMLDDREKLVHQLTDLDRSKTDIMVTVNHEFSKPLTAINAQVASLLDGERGDLRPAVVHALRAVEDNGARLEHLVAELLDTSRLEAGILTPALRPIYLSGILKRAAHSTRALAKANGVSVTVECDNFALVVDADAGQLERAFADLIENAVKFSPGGTVLVSGDASPRQGEIVVRVIDDGIGIPADDVPRLFTRFFRAQNVVASTIPGVGLGLSIARHVIRAHGGTVSITSVLGRGTTAVVRLPVSAAGMPVPLAEARAKATR